jgi:hypothetical protein
MSDIQRYIICVPDHTNDFKNIEKASYGGLVLYTDHLAALAEKDVRTSHIKKLTETLENTLLCSDAPWIAKEGLIVKEGVWLKL